MTEPLTQREMDVWLLLAAGLTTAESATRLGIARSSVGVYRKTLYSKLETAANAGKDEKDMVKMNAVRATLAAVGCGLVEPPTTLAPVVTTGDRRSWDRKLTGNRWAGKRSRRACTSTRSPAL